MHLNNCPLHILSKLLNGLQYGTLLRPPHWVVIMGYSHLPLPHSNAMW